MKYTEYVIKFTCSLFLLKVFMNFIIFASGKWENTNSYNSPACHSFFLKAALQIVAVGLLTMLIPVIINFCFENRT